MNDEAGLMDPLQHSLDQRVFHLKTLYDVSREIFATVDSNRILKTFLLMTMGNFGILEGFITLFQGTNEKRDVFLSVGLGDPESEALKSGAKAFLLAEGGSFVSHRDTVCLQPDFLPPPIVCAIPFSLEEDCVGMLGLGAKIAGEPFGEADQELLLTLVNNLVVSLRNARSFEEIEWLNRFLRDQNIQLEHANVRLKAALRKVEMLESVKAGLSKFVPSAVCKMLEKSPQEAVFESREQDVSVLFLDIEGYTALCERLSAREVNRMIERHFSEIVEAIHANDGDVNETAGDGLMVLFLDESRTTNALQAVRTALEVHERLSGLCGGPDAGSNPLVVNMGINSGPALVGAAKFESGLGSRWTYTARGMTTNIAARLGALASGGKVLLSAATAERVRDQFPLASLGRFHLKNVSEEVEVYALSLLKEHRHLER